MRFTRKPSVSRIRTTRRSTRIRLAGLGLAASVTLSGLAGGASPAAAAPGDPSYAFWGRQVDLPAGTFYRAVNDHDGDNALDLGATRFDGSNWRDQTGTWEEYAADPDNEDWLVWDKPVFSPVSGKVLTCWRNHPENIRPVVNEGDDIVHPMRYEQLNPDGTKTRKIIGAGNHLSILTDNGDVVLLAHLKSGSIPRELCPFYGEYVYDADNKGGTDFPLEAITPEARRPSIEQGQFAGRVGNSGRSSQPHLHIQRLVGASVDPPVMGTLELVRYHGIYAAAQAAGGDTALNWQPVQDSALVPGQLVYASPFRLEGSLPAGNASQASTALIPNVGTITAARNENGNLEISTQRVSDGKVFAVETDEYGPASEIAVSPTANNEDFVAAMRDSGGNLKLIGFHTKPGGFYNRTGSASGGPVSQVSIARVPQGLGSGNAVVTAVRDSNGKLSLTTWEVGENADTITPVSTLTGVAVSDVAIVPISNGRPLSSDGGGFLRGVVTVARDAQGNLRADSWSLTSGLQIAHKGQNTAGAVSEISAAAVRIDSAHDAVIAGMKDGTGNLRLKMVVADGTGNVTWHGTATGGAIQALTLAPSDQDVVAAMRDGDGRLRLMTFRASRSGELGRQGETFVSVPVSYVSVASPVVSGGTWYVMGTFGTSIVDNTLAWRYAM